MSGRQRVDTCNNSCFLSNHPWDRERRTVLMLPCYYFVRPAFRLITQERALRFFVGYHIASTLCLPDVTAHDQIAQAFPLCICILQAIKFGMWEWPGNEPSLKYKEGVVVILYTEYMWTERWVRRLLEVHCLCLRHLL